MLLHSTRWFEESYLSPMRGPGERRLPTGWAQAHVMWQWRPQRCGEVPSSLSLLFTNSKLSDANTDGGSQVLTVGHKGLRSQSWVLPHQR